MCTITEYDFEVNLLPSGNRRIDGDNTLYHYFDKYVLDPRSKFAMETLKRLLADLSIWIPRNFYRELPIILPYVIRDPSCRRRKKDETEEWGSANALGFLRDDNTLIKGVVNSFVVRSSRMRSYNGLRKGRGFVACHIWRLVRIQNDVVISNRHYLLNSYVPNLVWLPRQIAKLTDREGSPAQKILKGISRKIYSDIVMPNEIMKLWDYLPYPEDHRDRNIDVDKLNFFVVPESWLNHRVKGLMSEMDRIVSLKDRYDSEMKKVKCSRYCPSLGRVPKVNRRLLDEWLVRYKGILTQLHTRRSIHKQSKYKNR